MTDLGLRSEEIIELCIEDIDWRAGTLVVRKNKQRRERICPHTIRHATAMNLLQSGVTAPVIALWLGHEDPATTHQYIEADLLIKEQALRRLHAPRGSSVRFRPRADLLTFLDGL